MKALISKEEFINNEDKLRSLYSSMIKGSGAAKYLSLIYSVASFTLAFFKYRDDLMYFIPLVIGGLLILGYAYKFLWLRGIKPLSNETEELLKKIKIYKEQTLKREKYESAVMTLWMLTLVPWYLEGEEITTGLVIGLIVVFYLFHLFGSWAFVRVKVQLEEMDNLTSEITNSEF